MPLILDSLTRYRLSRNTVPPPLQSNRTQQVILAHERIPGGGMDARRVENKTQELGAARYTELQLQHSATNILIKIAIPALVRGAGVAPATHTPARPTCKQVWTKVATWAPWTHG